MVVSGESSSLALRNGVTPKELLDFLRRRQRQMNAANHDDDDTSKDNDSNDNGTTPLLWKDCTEKLQLLQDWTLYRKPRLEAAENRAREAAAARDRCVEVLLHKKRIMTHDAHDDDAGAKSRLPWSLAASTVVVSEDGGTREEEERAACEIWGEHWQDLDRMIRLYHWFLVEQGHLQKQQSSSGRLRETNEANPLRLIRLANIAKRSASTTQDEGGDERTGTRSEDDEDHRCASSTSGLLRHELTRLGAFLKQHQRQQQQENDSGPRLPSVISSKNDGGGGDNGPNKEELAIWIRQVDNCRSATDNSSNPTVVATSETNDDGGAKPPPLTAIIENARDRLRDRLERAEAAARQSRERFEMAGAELRSQTLEHQTYVQQVESSVAVLLGKDDDGGGGAASEQKGMSGIVRILI